MNIQTLKLHNYRMFEDLELNLDPHYTLIIGKNGVGKSSILEAAALAASTLFYKLNGVNKPGFKKTDANRKYFPFGSNEDVQQQYPVDITATGIVDGNKISWKRSLNTPTSSITIVDAKDMAAVSESYQERLQEGDHSLILPVIAYYSTGRLWDYHREKREDAFKYNTRTNGYIDCLDGTANTKLMMNWFKKMTIEKYQRQELGEEEQPELKTVYRAMADCMGAFTSYEDPKIQYKLDTNDLNVYYTDEKGLRVKIPLELMSDGYKELISVVADIAYRMAVLNPHLMDAVLKETDGIILIDEIDLHLHPTWQQQVVKVLTTIFPKVQFIFTTHAPAVIGSVDNAHIRILDNQDIRTAASQTYGKDASWIVKHIMDGEERSHEIIETFRSFYHAVDNMQYDAAQEILDELNEQIGDDAELAAMQVQLDMERM